MTWSPNQQVALAITPKISAFLSFAGSSWIVVQVLCDSQKRIDKGSNVYSRLLFGLSLFEAFESIWNFASTWPIPRGTEGVFGAIGSTQTCTAQGFFLQLGLAVPFYNACLAIYYFLIIKYNVSDDNLRKNIEPYMHAIAVLFPFSTCIVCLSLDLFNNANLWCWIAPLPLNCTGSGIAGNNEQCQRGENAWIYRWAFYFAPLWSCIVTVVVTMAIVYRFVRAKDELTLKYRRPRVQFGEDTMVRYSVPDFEPDQSNSTAAKLDTNDAMEDGPSEIMIAAARAQHYSMQSEDPSISGRSDVTPNLLSLRHSLGAQSEVSLTSESAVSEDTRRSIRSSVSARVSEWKENRSQRVKDLRRSHEVWQQAFWYTFAFLWTHLFSTINRTLQLTIGHTFFPLLLLHSFFDPFQGFLNFLVYRRPRYILFRRRGVPRLTAINRALRWSSTYPAGIIDNNSSGSHQGRGTFGSRRVIPPHRPTVLRLTAPSSELGFGPDSNGDSESVDLGQGSEVSEVSQDERASLEKRTADHHFEGNDEFSGVAMQPVVRDTGRRASSDAVSLTVCARAVNTLPDLQGDSRERRQSLRVASFSALLVAEDEAAARDAS